jgi:hypothetical protein
LSAAAADEVAILGFIRPGGAGQLSNVAGKVLRTSLTSQERSIWHPRVLDVVAALPSYFVAE